MLHFRSSTHQLFVVFKFRKSWTKFHMYGPVVLIAVIGLILSIVNHVAEMYGIYVLVRSPIIGLSSH